MPPQKKVSSQVRQKQLAGEVDHGRRAVLAAGVMALPVISLVTAAVPNRGKTFYISATGGNDKWAGTSQTPVGNNGPWKTFARASAMTFAPGDRILLKCGDTWNEELHPKGSGTPENPILINSYGQGAKPIIDRLDDKQGRNGIHLSDRMRPLLTEHTT